MAETEARDAQDIGSDEAYTCNLKNILDTHFNITAKSLEQQAVELAAINTQSRTELAAINQITISHLKDMAMLTHQGAAVAQDRVWNVDEQAHIVGQILNSPFGEAIKAAVAAATTDAQKSA